MPDIPYKYLKDENWETFYPITGASSINGQVPIANGGTASSTAAGARANLGAISAEDVQISSQPNDFVVSVSEGGTGAQTAAVARANLGLSFKTIEFNYGSYTVNANVNYSMNLKSAIDSHMPSGYHFVAIVGILLNNGSLYVVNAAYADSPYSFTVRNNSSAAITVTSTFIILIANSEIEDISEV